jgi:DNA replication licensing factor MCM2
VDLTDPILSRFDILTVIKDDAKEEVDDSLATFVLNSHMRSHPIAKRALQDDEKYAEYKESVLNNLLDETNVMKTEAKMQIDQDLLKKYIMYSKRFVHPKLNEIDKEKLT